MRALLDAGDFLGAWRTTDEATGPELWLARTEVLYRAGDPAGALAVARQGLQETPEDLDLLYWAASSSIWLGDGDLALRYSERLGGEVEGAVTRLGPEDARAWREAARGFRTRSEALIDHARELDASVTHAREVACGTVLVVLMVLAWWFRQGRSSSPVS